MNKLISKIETSQYRLDDSDLTGIKGGTTATVSITVPPDVIFTGGGATIHVAEPEGGWYNWFFPWL